VLPEAVAHDAERLLRFEREAKAVAALSHPNILAVHDTGTDAGRTYVVMELLDGETLRERLASGPLPVRKAIDAAVQMAHGLAAAHDKGLVHRDLKPENVFLTRDGQVKILDFGLAKPAATGSGSAETAVALTDPGSVMGTVGYMAPEQVRGNPVDARADLFALGAVLYEMLTGRRAFQRDTTAETMTAVLREDPPALSGTQAALSPALDRTVRHCLEKEPSERFQAARDVAFALEALAGADASASGGVPPPVGAATVGRWRRGLLVAASVSVAALVALAFWAWQRWPSRQPPAAAPTLTRLTFDRQSIANARFMPDGREVVFSVSLPDGSASLYTVRPGSAAPQPIGQPRTHLLAVSKNRELLVLTDASWLAQRLYTGTLARMRVDGAPVALQEHVRDANWAPNGEDLAIVRDSKGQDQLEYPVGTVLYETPGYVSDIRISPDGSRVAFMDHPARYDSRGFVKMVDRSRAVTTLAGEYPGEEGLAWTPDGASVVFSAEALSADNVYQVLAVRIDSPGRPSVVLPGGGSQYIFDIGRGPEDSWLINGCAGFSGIMVLTPGQSREREFVWHHYEWNPSLSSDGRQLMFTDGSAGANYAVAVRAVDDPRVKRLGEGDARGFSPDDRWALALITRESRLVAYRIGLGSPRQLELNTGRLEHLGAGESLSWYPDSAAVLACGNEPGGPPRCYRIALAGGPPEPVTPDGVIGGWVSRDGRILVRRSDGTMAVLAASKGAPRAVPGVTQADAAFGWTADGRSLYGGRPGLPFKLEKIDIETGRRTLLKELAPPDRNGVGMIGSFYMVNVLPDGRGYAYLFTRSVDTLYAMTNASALVAR